MSSQATQFTEQTLAAWYKGTSFPASGQRYVELHTSDPGNTGGAGVSGEFDGRQALSCAAASGRSVSSNADLTWTGRAAGTGDITHVSIWDALSGGNCLWVIQLSSAVAVPNGDDFEISSGSLTMEWSAGAVPDSIANDCLDWAAGSNDMAAAPAAVYLGFADGGVEETLNCYASRPAVTFTGTNPITAVAGTFGNSTGTATASQGILADGSGAGANIILGPTALLSSKSLVPGKEFKWGSSDFTFTIS